MASAGLVALSVLMVLILGGALYHASLRTGDSKLVARRLSLVSIFMLCGWLFMVHLVASAGFFSAWDARPPRLFILPFVAILSMVLMNRTARMARFVEQIPASWPIYAQSFRVAVELLFFALYMEGKAPVQVTFEGRNFDILVGLAAPVMGWLVARRKVSHALSLAWNIAGVAILANIIGTAATSIPGPLHLNWPGEPFVALGTSPVVFIPGFLAPLAIFLHVLSIRQALYGLRSKEARTSN